MLTSKRSHLFLVFVLAALALVSLAAPTAAARGYAQVRDGTLVADNGELLRGIFFDPDWTPGAMPSEEQVRLMRDYGFNTLHVYGEHPCPSEGLVGGTVRPNHIDTLVDYTRDNDLYMVLTIGQLCPQDNIRIPLPPSNNPLVDYETWTYERQFSLDFWEEYAHRYRNETHLIYELINEPWWIFHPGTVHSQGYPSTLLDDEADVYLVARGHAPNTPILLFSYGGFNNTPAPEQDPCCATVQHDWNALNARLPADKKLRPTTKDAVSFHPYHSGTLAQLRSTADTVRGWGIPIIFTEGLRHDTVAQCGSVAAKPCIDEAAVEAWEAEGVSWLSFLKARQNLADATDWDLRVKDQLEFGSPAPPALIWVPDDPEATWPVQRAPDTWCDSLLDLQWLGNGKWVQPGADRILRADVASPSEATRWRVVCRPSGKVWLQDPYTLQYVDPGSMSQSTPLRANVGTPGPAHEFDLLLRRDGTLVLRSPFATDQPGWRIISGDASSKQLFDNQTKLVDSAAFDWLVTSVNPCTPDFDTLCLLDGRFEATLTWTNQWTGQSGVGHATPHPAADTTGFFWFFEDFNLEVGVKVLDGGDHNGHFWVYHGAMTTFHYTLTVRDTETGKINVYQKANDFLCGNGDVNAYPNPPGTSGPTSSGGSSSTPGGIAAGCLPGSQRVCLMNRRFQVEVLRDGVPQLGTGLNDQVGSFHFFSEDNPEVFVKMYHPINNFYWFFFGSMTDVDYEIVVTDTWTRDVRIYVPPSPVPPEAEVPGLATLCGDLDTFAFPGVF